MPGRVTVCCLVNCAGKYNHDGLCNTPLLDLTAAWLVEEQDVDMARPRFQQENVCDADGT